MNGPLLTVAEASVIARRHPVTTRRALEAGDLHGFQRVVGGRWSIQPACLEAWIECRSCGHQSNVLHFRRSA
ncbi:MULTISPECIES: helix-turn-helix domain-containing protein [Clavibacter]|uniref:DNA-binding protein n=2 Tax=Clavibacter TaxID=1573 RepID=A0A399P2H2_9MICO|nr:MULTISPECIES: helix-turn-helix domain-containing protein [Clavibacter]KDP90898.1 hypothetical protein W824_09475 [Clavibacter cf. michiganensis LMG 26808]RII98986.1 DNA-binding protein [Clavibacter michiganensis]UKF24633.1 helix-turn-helix domain-containing protein [Clavibacter sp. A6099]